MPHRGQISSDAEVRDARREGIRGGVNGAARWGLAAGVLAVGAYCVSPIYRNLTFQFKLYLQMSVMSVGAMIEGERRVREFEERARRIRKIRSDQAARQRIDEEYERSGRRDFQTQDSARE